MKKKLLLVFGLLVTIAAIIAAIMVFNRSDNSTQQPTKVKTITKIGTFGCLLPSGNGPHTMECAFGLRQIDGTQYALKANDPAILNQLSTAQNQTVEVTGTLEAIEQPSGYQTAGTIKVISIKKL